MSSQSVVTRASVVSGLRWLAVVALISCGGQVLRAADPATRATEGPGQGREEGAVVTSVEKIWDRAPHNAFTDLIQFDGKTVCAFRTAVRHAGGTKGSTLQVIVSADGDSPWNPVTTLADPRGDVRDAKMAVVPDGRLMLLTAIRLYAPKAYSHQSIAWYTRDLKTWEGPVDVGETNMWLWGIKWHKGAGYSIGYSTGKEHFVRLYRTTDGRTFETVVDRLDVPAPYPNESAMAFDRDDVAHVLLRCDPDPAFVGTARPPYTDWTWKQSNLRVGGPALTWAPDGRLLGAGRLHVPTVHTALFRVDPKSAAITEIAKLPSSGDTSYPGLVWDGNILLMSYYSAHGGKCEIYRARVSFPAGDSGGAGGSGTGK